MMTSDSFQKPRLQKSRLYSQCPLSILPEGSGIDGIKDIHLSIIDDIAKKLPITMAETKSKGVIWLILAFLKAWSPKGYKADH